MKLIPVGVVHSYAHWAHFAKESRVKAQISIHNSMNEKWKYNSLLLHDIYACEWSLHRHYHLHFLFHLQSIAVLTTCHFIYIITTWIKSPTDCPLFKSPLISHKLTWTTGNWPLLFFILASLFQCPLWFDRNNFLVGDY